MRLCRAAEWSPLSLLRHPQFGRPHRVASPMDPSATASIHPSIPIPLSIEFSKDESLCPSIHSIPLAVSFVGVKLHLGRASEGEEGLSSFVWEEIGGGAAFPWDARHGERARCGLRLPAR